MATNSIYSIGQYRSGASQETYITNLIDTNNSAILDADAITPGIQTWVVTALDGTESTDIEQITFRDKAIVLNNGYNENHGKFSKNKTYFLRIKIPRNVAHNITYDIKLTNLIPNNESENNDKYFYDENASYQHLKRVTVLKGSDFPSQLTKKIVIGKLSNTTDEMNDIVASIVDNEYSTITENEVVIDGEKQKIIKYIGNGNEEIVLEKTMELAVDISELVRGKSEQQQNYEIVEILFKPLNNDFNGIIIEKVREILDYNTQFIENNKTYYGLYTEVIDPELYEVNNLIGSEIPHSPLSKIGVWSHSGLCMCINGEEIRIGARGYYELNVEDFDITEFGVVVEDLQLDRFIVDYEYRV